MRLRPSCSGGASSASSSPLWSVLQVALDLEAGDYDVAVPDLAKMGVIGPHPDITLPVDIAAEGNVAGAIGPDGGLS